ncbi:hypothetical protein TWF696_009005 [Orbilia brochopaga]|uniref:Bacterial surface antigen (D15) domain-containing protein n=1 Tax=Orbilia brochopaga TaxID=3140254 RepID=A0AAV9UEP1_9PEZI
MAVGENEDVFDILKNAASPGAVAAQQAAQKAREEEIALRAQQRAAETIQEHSSQPVYFDSITISGAGRTRRSFLENIVKPSLDRSDKGELTLRDALAELNKTIGNLRYFDIFQPNIPFYLDTPPSYTFDPSKPNDPIPLTATINVKERSRFLLKTGTDLGNTEGSAYAQATLRNVFGGAESLHATASAGTRTRSAYDATFTTPIKASPLASFELKALSTSRDNSHSSHTELSKGVIGTVRWATPAHHLHQSLSYEGLWRTITSVHEDASPSVRRDAGDSIKSALTHTIARDTRDNPILPSTGTLLRFRNSLAGFGPFRGTVAHLKSELETGLALPLFKGVSVTSSFRGGVLYPLALSGETGPKPSSIADRFHIGGSNDVRGFQTGGLGPHSGKDSLGGDAFVAGSVGVLFPFPRASADSGLRFQAFVNGGRLLALQRPPGAETAGVGEGMKYTVSKLLSEAPSLAAGFGIVYGHPVARFELNFCLPLGMRGTYGEEGAERARKGLQFGVGIEFL